MDQAELTNYHCIWRLGKQCLVELIYENADKGSNSTQTVKNFKHICQREQCSRVPFTRWAAGFMTGCVTETHQDKRKLEAPSKASLQDLNREPVLVLAQQLIELHSWAWVGY